MAKRFNVLTIFPDIFAPVETGVIGKAVENGLISINTINIRDFSKDRHKNTDDYPYGGGEGMLMTPQPLYDAWKSIEKPGKTIVLSPKGAKYNQQKCLELSENDNITIVCGRYEGIDKRVVDLIADEEISIGDYVISGGELAAMILIDSVSRLVPGVLGNENGSSNDSHFQGLLEYPQYTRPADFMGIQVPEILLSGNHAKVDEFRKRESLILTWSVRPDMIRKRGLDREESEILADQFPEDTDEFIKLLKE